MFGNFEGEGQVESSDAEGFGKIRGTETLVRYLQEIARDVFAVDAEKFRNAEVSEDGEPVAIATADVDDALWV